MLIQRVVIQGFKTFAKRTEFVFDAGVTAVVGPNGSGKSNIVDAIRWCLGEQSFSLLRSRKTSDVIFSGSDKRARLGMAQVSLTLDNTGGEIPLEYAQVEISRRAYQDGENEYLVNGQRVRLSDIAELLSQTGLGKRTYAVVGQGLIDRVLSLAPEERRSLFEEAAGISGYQAKREAALRRLDATEANLTRVRDIAAELEPRLGYLKRQADRAIERAQMAADLRGLLREWYGYKWHAALAALEDFRADALIMRNTIAAREEELARLATRVEKVRREQIEVRSALNERHRAASELHTNSERVSRELAVARERQRQTLERTEEMVRDLNPLRVQQDTMTERLATTRAELEEAQGTLASHRAELAKTNAALELHRAEQRKRQNVLDEKRRNANAAQNRHAEALSRQQERRERLAGLDGSETRLASGVETSAREAETTLARVRAAEAERTQMDVRIAELATQIATLGDARNRARTALESAENARRAADRDADRLQTRLDLLQRLSNEGAGMASGVRAVMQAKRNGILGPVAALLRVPAELDKAIETALGGALQNLIAESWEDAHGAINYLKGQQRGRATFLPLDRLNFGSPIKAPRMDGVLGNAAELVECDARITRARDQLLNRVWIVQDLPTARRALDTLRDAPRPTVVTLDGEIVRPGGAVTGGSDGSREDNSVLQRERELRELPAQVSAAASAAKSAATECQRLNTEDAALRAQREEAQRNHADLTRQERTQQSALAELRRAADRAEQQREFAQQQAKQIASERAHLLAQLEEGETQVTRLMSERETSAQELTEAESTVESDGGEELLRTLADQRALEAHADGLRASRAGLVTQQERTLADLAAQIAAKENRIAALTQENEELAGRLGGLHEEERSLRAEISALQTEIAPLETQVAALEAEQGSAESEERAVQQTQRRDEAAWSHLQVALQRSEDTVSQLQSEILRDLGLVTLEQSDDIALQQPLPFEAFVEALPVRDALPEGMDEEVTGMRARLGRLTNVNPEAPREYEEASSRFIHLTTQADDLSAAAADLHKIVKNLDELMQSELARTFAAVAVEFQHEFRKLFNGGTAELVLTDPDNIASSGIDIIARPPGKRPQALALLSGGERSLAACALIFAILRVSPTPFCVLDEVDAALDEANVDRFRLAVSDLSALMQFIIVTHNRRTLEGANTIYGVTMGNDGVSRVIGLRLEGDAIVHNKNGNGASPQEDAPSQAEVEEIVAI